MSIQENQGSLEINEAHQLLFDVHDANLIGKKITNKKRSLYNVRQALFVQM
jgi:hypothetical protein